MRESLLEVWNGDIAQALRWCQKRQVEMGDGRESWRGQEMHLVLSGEVLSQFSVSSRKGALYFSTRFVGSFHLLLYVFFELLVVNGLRVTSCLDCLIRKK